MARLAGGLSRRDAVSGGAAYCRELVLGNLGLRKAGTIVVPSRTWFTIQRFLHKGVVSQIQKLLEKSPREHEPEPPICLPLQFHGLVLDLRGPDPATDSEERCDPM